MPLKTILFLVLFGGACLGALFIPMAGIIGYMGMYHIGYRWWLEPLASLHIRYSFTLALFLGIGTVLHWSRLRYGKRFMTSQEWLLLAMVGILWLSRYIGLPRGETALWEDPAEIKITKVVIFAFLLTHVVTTASRLSAVLWVMVVGGLYLGWLAFSAGPGAFVTGRVEGMGGPDFKDANFFGVHLATVLPIIAVQFVRSEWRVKLLALLAGVFAVNGLIMTRSRGAFLAAAVGGLMAIPLAPKGRRAIIIVVLLIGMVGAYALTDPGFIDRMSTIETSPEEMDKSSYGRWLAWKTSLVMLRDRPHGFGVGNFPRYVGGYEPLLADRDPHNTFVKCYTELGVQGLIVFLALIGNAVHMLWRAPRMAEGTAAEKDIRYFSYAMLLALAIFLAGGMTVTETYIEEMWWFLALPVCLYRVAENARTDAEADTTLLRDLVS